MDSAEIALKSAGPPGSIYLDSQPRAGKASASVCFVHFMLAQPEPADLIEDVHAAKEALGESDARIPYEQIRRELGLS